MIADTEISPICTEVLVPIISMSIPDSHSYFHHCQPSTKCLKSDLMSWMDKVYRPRKREKQKTVESPVVAWLKKDGWAAIGIILLVIVGLWFGLVKNSRLVVSVTQLNELEFLNADTVRENADNAISTPILGFWPRNSYVTVSTDRIEKTILDALGDDLSLKAVSVTKHWPNEIHINIEERVPAVAWVTKAIDGNESFYLVDYDGTVSQILPNFDTVDQRLPRVRDDNREKLGLGWHIMSADYITFLMAVNDRFTGETGLSVDSYVFPETRCQERQFVAEKIFEQEILESASEEFKDQKREIQELFQQGLLTIDQSLEQLEAIKQAEIDKIGEVQSSSSGVQKLEWQAVYMDTECDYVNVATDLHVVVPVNGKSIEVKLDRGQDLTVQLENIVTVMQTEIEDINTIQYIDVRIPDRVYYK